MSQFASQITTPSLCGVVSELQSQQPADDNWSRFEAPLAERILLQVFEDSDRALMPWLVLGLVCRCDTCHTAASQATARRTVYTAAGRYFHSLKRSTEHRCRGARTPWLSTLAK